MKHFYVCLAVLVTCILTACSEGEVAPEILPGAGSEIYFEDAMNFGSDVWGLKRSDKIEIG